jgi:hypothetical protein
VSYTIDPNEPLYQENGVNFDVDDVEILGSTSLTAQVLSAGSIHPHHDGWPGNAVSALLNDNVRAVVLGSSTGAGDPVDIDTDDIVAASVRIGPLGGTSHTNQYNLNVDGDGLEDARFRSVMSDAIGDTRITNEFLGVTNRAGRCLPAPFDWQNPTIALRAELTTGEVIAGEDLTVNVNCNAQCHTGLDP